MRSVCADIRDGRGQLLPSKGRIQMSKTNYLQAVISDLQRAAGPYKCAMNRHRLGIITSQFGMTHEPERASTSEERPEGNLSLPPCCISASADAARMTRICPANN